MKVHRADAARVRACVRAREITHTYAVHAATMVGGWVYSGGGRGSGADCVSPNQYH